MNEVNNTLYILIIIYRVAHLCARLYARFPDFVRSIYSYTFRKFLINMYLRAILVRSNFVIRYSLLARFRVL